MENPLLTSLMNVLQDVVRKIVKNHLLSDLKSKKKATNVAILHQY